jgi:hypothetical protein
MRAWDALGQWCLHKDACAPGGEQVRKGRDLLTQVPKARGRVQTLFSGPIGQRPAAFNQKARVINHHYLTLSLS